MHPNRNKPHTHTNTHTNTNSKLVVPRAQRIGIMEYFWTAICSLLFLFTSNLCASPFRIKHTTIFDRPLAFPQVGYPVLWNDPVKHSHRCFARMAYACYARMARCRAANLSLLGAQWFWELKVPKDVMNVTRQRQETNRLHLEEERRRLKGIYQNCEQSALMEHPNVARKAWQCRKLHVKHDWL